MIARLLAAATLLLTLGAAPAAEPSVARAISPATLIDWPTTGQGAVTALGVTVINAPQPCRAGDHGEDCVIPGAHVTAPGQPPLLLTTRPGAHAKLGIGPFDRGGRAAVMLRVFTGGAHCCESVAVAAPVATGWRLVDLGQWNGADITFPRDVSGDGVADFAVQDDAFYYAFGCYACTTAPPLFLNVIDGRKVDVSRTPGFRPAFERDLTKNRALCLKPGGGNNGPCATWAADAARLGRIAPAWREILVAYDRAMPMGGFPTGCRVARDASHRCPQAATITYATYPAALRAFLIAHDYLPASTRLPLAR